VTIASPRRSWSVRVVVLFAIAIVASIGFASLAEEVREGELDALDHAIALAVHRADSPAADVVMKAATVVGSSAVLIPCGVVIAALAIWRGHRRAAIILAIDAAVVLLSNVALKLMFARARPTLWEKITLPDTYSFPSGHAMAAVGVWGVVFAVASNLAPRARGVLIAVAVVLALAIGISRVYLGVHWPLDVIGGYAAGIPPLVVSIYLLGRGQAGRGVTPSAGAAAA
jgi:membrane-associated phospholipid phosphatase